ncbi:hypothetical protein BJ741DRAFT_706750 [Chytriomyces cf. hyalinus JEL632]|nr:hypothetical protein BJ741DRAFT_706750 [Chytriomyces cf. hyalinus JEL632]
MLNSPFPAFLTGSASIPHQADDKFGSAWIQIDLNNSSIRDKRCGSTGSEVVEDAAPEEQGPCKSALWAMSKFPSTWIQRDSKNSSIQFPTFESTGGEAVDDCAPKYDFNNGASMPNQMADDSTGGEVMEDVAPGEETPRKNELRAMNKFPSAWIQRDSRNTSIWSPTVDSTGGEVMDDLAPQATLPRKCMFKGFKRFGAAALKLFWRKNAPSNREKDITACLNCCPNSRSAAS